MKIITIYAVVCNGDIITTSRKEEFAVEQADILNKVNNTSDYIVVPCNGVCI